MNLKKQYKRLFEGKVRSNDKTLLKESHAWERVSGQSLPTVKDVAKKHNESLNEAMVMKIGNDYSVFDPGDGEWREDMEYLGYASHRQAHFFRAFGSPGSKEVVIMEVPKSREMKDIM
tara:strand:- start:49 stop:402 length:354 start_codon:yes stop_codon:yes gene_type:complete